MANPEHLEILKRGVEAWNEWRDENWVVQFLDEPDLSCADLRDIDLLGANFSEANLSGANLNGVSLRNINLIRANLIRANLTCVDLSFANLISTELFGANFNRAALFKTLISDSDLTGTDFSDANLDGTVFEGDILVNADFSKAVMNRSMFVGVDISEVKNLESVIHFGPSSIDIDTIYKSRGNIPEKFLRGCGVPESFIVQIPALVASIQPIQFYSCFISYSSKDEEFAERLYADLQNKGVRCWFAPEDLKIGERFRVRIDESIRLYDKLLLVLSENSVSSQWVEKEVETAFEKEDEQKKTVLFPLRLDDSVLEIKTGWAADVRRSRHIGDFTDWKNHDSYRKAFERLMRDLKAEASR
jgi:TIR domain/Pentapeptide repeats (8 copies)